MARKTLTHMPVMIKLTVEEYDRLCFQAGKNGVNLEALAAACVEYGLNCMEAAGE